MQLNDLIEEHTIESIAKKTNVAEGVITKLFNKEFKMMNSPQAMGAISIIEREYDVDLSALRQECKAYFADYNSSESVLLGITPIKEEKRVFPRFLVFVLLIMLASGAWYFFTEYYGQKILPLVQKSEKFLTDTILTGDDNASKEVQKDTALKSISQSDVMTDQVNKSAAKQGDESDQGIRAVISEVDTGEEGKKEGIEANQSIPSAASKTVIGEQNDLAATAEANETITGDDSAKQVPVVVIARETMTLLPQGLMWFRLTNLDTKEKRSFKRKDRYEINLRENDWLFATENSHFAIIDNDHFEEFDGEGKLFFQLDQEGIHQLSEDEYRTAEK